VGYVDESGQQPPTLERIRQTLDRLASHNRSTRQADDDTDAPGPAAETTPS
jgi:hypothetical protein